MVLSKRERYILLAAAVTVAGFMLDQFVLTPIQAARDQAYTDQQRLLKEIRDAQLAVTTRRELEPQWRQELSNMKSDPGEAESQLLSTLLHWAQDSGVSISLLRPERLTEKTTLPEIAVHVAGTGTMESISKMLWQMQTADIPLRIVSLQMTARKDGTDDLSVQLRLSTLYLPEAARLIATRPAAGMPATSADERSSGNRTSRSAGAIRGDK